VSPNCDDLAAGGNPMDRIQEWTGLLGGGTSLCGYIWTAVTMFAAASGLESKGRDKGLQLFPGRFYFSCCIPDGGRKGGDRGFGFAELVERLLV
jgi:hypothetical protein